MIVVTPKVNNLMPLFGEDILAAIEQFKQGIYNTTDEPQEGDLPFGIYKLSQNITVWIMDDSEGNTTILFPEEY